MAYHKSSLKRIRQTIKISELKSSQRTALRTSVKKAKTAIAKGDAKEMAAQVLAAVKTLAKAGGKLMHKKTASRRISRLQLAANKAANK